MGTFGPRGLGRRSAERLIMDCKKMCSNSRTKWALLGSASVALVIAIGLILSFVLQPHSPPGRGPCHAIWLASPSTALTPLSHPTSPAMTLPINFPLPLHQACFLQPRPPSCAPEWTFLLRGSYRHLRLSNGQVPIQFILPHTQSSMVPLWVKGLSFPTETWGQPSFPSPASCLYSQAWCLEVSASPPSVFPAPQAPRPQVSLTPATAFLPTVSVCNLLSQLVLALQPMRSC